MMQSQELQNVVPLHPDLNTHSNVFVNEQTALDQCSKHTIAKKNEDPEITVGGCSKTLASKITARKLSVNHHQHIACDVKVSPSKK
jgi:hypothetical protein